MPTIYSNALEWLNTIFGILYNIEALIKLSAIGNYYFNSKWNK
jgi:hypothetical protein